MSEMNFGHLLPFYLDETDEQVIALNDALLKLEQDQTDAAALAVAFRIVHTIKGSSAALGFTEVNKLTHHLESFFDMLRSGERKLDRDSLDLFFNCLDELKNYHQRLRNTGESEVDFGGLIQQVILQIRKVQEGSQTPKPKQSAGPATPITESIVKKVENKPSANDITIGEVDRIFAIQIKFQDDLSLPDMKARLIAKRLSNLGDILSSEPPLEKLDSVHELTGILFHLSSESSDEEIRKTADMSGVSSIDVQLIQPQSTVASETGSFSMHLDTPDQQEIQPELPTEKIESASGQVTNRGLPDKAIVKNLADEPQTTVQSSVNQAKNEATPKPESETPVKPAEKSPPKTVGKVGETVRVELDRLDHLMNLTGELVLSKSRFIQVSSALNDKLGNSRRRHQPNDSLDRVEHLKSSLSAVISGQSTMESVAHRMNDELRRLAEDIESMSVELNRVKQARSTLEDLGEAVHQLTRVCDGLQKGVLDTRMIPIGPLFERFRRVIRDLSHATGKEIKLKISGETTELDKRVIDELADPLVHMVRNAGDHGLERPEDREAAGKPRAGTISLAAAHSGDRVTITVSDDGRGINADRIRTKIVEKGLVDQSTASKLTDRELVNYIWHPGLSTAESVTDISGRGVGMDIVKSRIESLNGTVDIKTQPGHGTTFVIRLPLTLAILPSLLVRVHEEIYAIALDHIREIVEVQPGQIHNIRKRRVIEIREKIVPVLSLDHLFQWGNRPYPAKPVEPENGDEHATTTRIVILHSADEMVGLVVDELMGLQEVVLKSLEKNLGPVEGLSGASILGNGRVSLILDVDRLIDKAAQGITAKSGVA